MYRKTFCVLLVISLIAFAKLSGAESSEETASNLSLELSESSSDLSESSSELPESSLKQRDSSSKQPESSSKQHESSSKQRESLSTQRESSSQQPESSSVESEESKESEPSSDLSEPSEDYESRPYRKTIPNYNIKIGDSFRISNGQANGGVEDGFNLEIGDINLLTRGYNARTRNVSPWTDQANEGQLNFYESGINGRVSESDYLPPNYNEANEVLRKTYQNPSEEPQTWHENPTTVSPKRQNDPKQGPKKRWDNVIEGLRKEREDTERQRAGPKNAPKDNKWGTTSPQKDVDRLHFNNYNAQGKGNGHGKEKGNGKGQDNGKGEGNSKGQDDPKQGPKNRYDNLINLLHKEVEDTERQRAGQTNSPKNSKWGTKSPQDRLHFNNYNGQGKGQGHGKGQNNSKVQGKGHGKFKGHGNGKGKGYGKGRG